MKETNLAPAEMVLHTVNGQSDHLHIALDKLITDFGCTGQFCGAHRREVTRMGEKNAPSEDGRGRGEETR